MIKCLLPVLILSSFLLIPSGMVSATSCGEKSQPMEGSKVVVQVDQRLRSAFLHRAAESGTYRSVMPVDKNIAELRRHFDAVLEILKANEMRALQISLNRLEEIQGKSWTIADRSLWREELSKRRSVQITRLELYRERGLFPQNEHANHTVPVFVDNYGTDCAVGHLMRESGAGELVDLVARTNNLVYVSDVFGGAMVQWIAHSGLTQEEAALIQPGYIPPPVDAFLSELGITGSVQHGGLRYENFKILAGKQVPGLSIENFNLFPVDTSQASVSIDNESYSAPCCEYVKLGTGFGDWLYFRTGGDFNSDAASESTGVVELIYSYDVVAVGSNAAISAASIASQFSFGGNRNSLDFFGEPRGEITVDTIIRSGPFATFGFGPIEATLHLATDESFQSFFNDSDSSSFSPQKSINVQTRVLLEDEWTFSSLIHTFELVPEPSSLGLCLLPALVCSLSRRSTK